jgi:hypothetical protein
MTVHVLVPQPAPVIPDTRLVELEQQLRAAVASADASNKTAAGLILLMIEKKGQSVRSIARLVGKSPTWVHQIVTWARDDYRDDPFSRSKRGAQPAEHHEPQSKTRALAAAPSPVKPVAGSSLSNELWVATINVFTAIGSKYSAHDEEVRRALLSANKAIEKLRFLLRSRENEQAAP